MTINTKEFIYDEATKLHQIESEEKILMSYHQIDHWNFAFDRAKVRMGSCDRDKKIIFLSRPLVIANLDKLKEIKDTILHEIAHAISPKSGHGREWKRIAKEIGAKPVSCYSKEIKPVQPRYRVVCATCSNTSYAYRKNSKHQVCSYCCDKYSSGRFDERFLLVWERM